MTEERYSFNWERGHPNFWDNHCDLADCYLTCEDVVNRLNELNDENQGLRNFKEKSDKFTKEVEKFFKKHNIDTVNFDLIEEEFELYRKENKELKFILQDMGLLMNDEEVRDIRTEIASKLIKPLFKGNGFNVDVNVENGFTIIPKEVNNDRE